MKNLVRNAVSLVLILFFMVPVINAQNVPSKVKEEFAKKFPNAKLVEWNKESVENFEAEFILDGQEMSANFDTEGNWQETEIEISHEELPGAVKETLQRDFQEAEIKHVFMVLTPEQTLYEVVVSNEKEERYEQNEENEEHEGAENEEDDEEEYNEAKHLQELVFTADGKLVKK